MEFDRPLTRTPVVHDRVAWRFKLSKRTEVRDLAFKFQHPQGLALYRVLPDSDFDAIHLAPGTWRVVFERVPHRVLWWQRVVAALDRFIAWLVQDKDGAA